MIGTEVQNRSRGLYFDTMVEERCMRVEAKVKTEVDFIQVTMQA